MIINANSLYIPLPDNSVHIAVTSPPYYGLRKYAGEPSVWPAAGRALCADEDHTWDEYKRLRQNGGDSTSSVKQLSSKGTLLDKVMGVQGVCAKCGSWRGMLGNEPAPQMYVQHMVAICREVKRVLRSDGTFWLNIGDSYAGSNGNGTMPQSGHATLVAEYFQPFANVTGNGTGLKAKNLIGIPWRLAFALQDDGWILRSDIIWAKLAPMPESVQDRCTRAHEYVFMFAKQADYFYDSFAVREKQAPASAERAKYGWNGQTEEGSGGARTGANFKKMVGEGMAMGETGMVPADGFRNKRTVWSVANAPYSGAMEDWSDYDFLKKGKPYLISVECRVHGGLERGAVVPQATVNDKACTCPRALTDVDHFAAWPPDLVRPMILAGTSQRGVCPVCGAPWERVIDSGAEVKCGHGASLKGSKSYDQMPMGGGNVGAIKHGMTHEKIHAGWQPTCGCEAGDPIPATVLDPFAGSGTTGAVCREHGRKFIGLDMSLSYLENLAKVRAEGLTPRAALESLPMFAITEDEHVSGA